MKLLLRYRGGRPAETESLDPLEIDGLDLVQERRNAEFIASLD